MKKLIIILIIVYYAIPGCKSSREFVSYCGNSFVKKSVKIYLVDEDVNATMIQLLDKKTKKHVFGYYVNGVRNDTNFIHSKIEFKGDTIINKTYHDYKVTYLMDSVISIYQCQNGIFKPISSTRYWNGKITSEYKY